VLTRTCTTQYPLVVAAKEKKKKKKKKGMKSIFRNGLHRNAQRHDGRVASLCHMFVVSTCRGPCSGS